MALSSGTAMEGRLALDMQGLERLKHSARMDPAEGARGAAQQFEALFIQMMVKSMRDAVPTSDLMGNKQTEMFQSMLDQQWSQTMAGRGIGLADKLVAELENSGMVPQGVTQRGESRADSLIAGIPRGTPQVLRDSILQDSASSSGTTTTTTDAGAEPKASDASSGKASTVTGGSGVDETLDGFMSQIAVARSASQEASISDQGFMAEVEARMPPQPNRAESGLASADRTDLTARSRVSDSPGSETRDSGQRPDHVRVFLDRLTGPAQAASRTTGVPAELILAQAALETGWGRREIPTHDGGNSHNLFGIKAGSQWQGETAEIVTHEFIGGQRQQVRDEFRVYDSFEEAFTDYAQLIGTNPRYSAVTEADSASAAAHALQKGGYATDPRYAEKLVAVMGTMGTLQDVRQEAQPQARNLAFLDAIR